MILNQNSRTPNYPQTDRDSTFSQKKGVFIITTPKNTKKKSCKAHNQKRDRQTTRRRQFNISGDVRFALPCLALC